MSSKLYQRIMIKTYPLFGMSPLLTINLAVLTLTMFLELIKVEATINLPLLTKIKDKPLYNKMT